MALADVVRGATSASDVDAGHPDRRRGGPDVSGLLNADRTRGSLSVSDSDVPQGRWHIVRWALYLCSVLATVGIVFLIAMFVAFAMDARSTALTIGWFNDVLVLVSYSLAAPAVFVLHALLGPKWPRWSRLAGVLGLVGILGVVLLQTLLVTGALTFEQQIGPVSLAFLAVAAWLVSTGFMGSRSGVLPGGTRMGLLGAIYVGLPLWAVWLARRLR
jgi:hypothetical protein